MLCQATCAQPVPSAEEGIPYLVTFGKEASRSWGDDDHCQVFFFVIPKKINHPVYIRVFDPDCGGDIDEKKGTFNTKTKFSVYGGKGSFTNSGAKKTQPVKGYDAGNLLFSKTFAAESDYDNKWYTFGPINPMEGEYVPAYGGNIIKFIAEGIAGDDGNLYKYYLSANPDNNKWVEGANAFTFEYTFRLPDNAADVVHIYPYVDDKVISIKQSNFDWDNDGYARIISIAKKGELIKTSGDNQWVSSEHKISAREKNSSLDIQFIKSKTKPVRNNNVVLYVKNQYGELLPFYASPIGGIPKYKYPFQSQPKRK